MFHFFYFLIFPRSTSMTNRNTSSVPRGFESATFISTPLDTHAPLMHKYIPDAKVAFQRVLLKSFRVPLLSLVKVAVSGDFSDESEFDEVASEEIFPSRGVLDVMMAI